jgi:branched-chain amino acid transport system permease protein
MIDKPIAKADSTAPSVVKTRAGDKIRTIFATVIFLALLLFPVTQLIQGGMNYWLHLLLYTFMYITMASSWNILGGYTGYVSLGHNVFFAAGAYLAAILWVYKGISPFIIAPVAGVLALVIGLIFGLITLRTSGSAFIISTIALTMLLSILLDKWKLAGGANGLSLNLIDLPISTAKLPFYYGFLLLAALTVYVSYRIRHSKFGLGLRAISQDETKAEVAGIPTNNYKILAFAISGLFVGVAGALWVYYLTYLRPGLFLNIGIAANMVLMSLIGGKGTVAGPVLGAVILIATNEFFVSQLGSSALNIVATGVLLILVLLFFPEGIIGTLKNRNLLPSFLDWE